MVEGKAEIPNIYGDTDVNGDLGIDGDASVDGATTLNAGLTVTHGGAAINGGSLGVLSGDVDGSGQINVGRFDAIPPALGGPRLMLLGATPGNSGAQVNAYEDDGGHNPAESTLHLNCDEGSHDVVISHRDGWGGYLPTVRVASPRFRVGFPGEDGVDPQPGNVDANGVDIVDQRLELRIGTMGETENVVIGRTNLADPNTNVTVSSQLRVGDVAGVTPGRIDSTPLPDDGPRSLEIGGQVSTSTVTIGRAGQNGNLWTKVVNLFKAVANIQVGTDQADGSIDAAANNRNLLLGTDANNTQNVDIGRDAQEINIKGRLDAEEHIRVGNAAAGQVDASANNLTLRLGTNANATGDVEIGRDQHVITASGRLDAVEHVRVGDANHHGQVDAAANNRTLKLGTDANFTTAVEIASANKVTTIKGDVNVSSKRLMLDAGSLYWIVYNAAGHAVPPPVRPSIDFAINGVVHFYVDDLGGHNL